MRESLGGVGRAHEAGQEYQRQVKAGGGGPKSGGHGKSEGGRGHSQGRGGGIKRAEGLGAQKRRDRLATTGAQLSGKTKQTRHWEKRWFKKGVWEGTWGGGGGKTGKTQESVYRHALGAPGSKGCQSGKRGWGGVGGGGWGMG